MFTKKFNNLSDSLIEAATKTLANPIVNEAFETTHLDKFLETPGTTYGDKFKNLGSNVHNVMNKVVGERERNMTSGEPHSYLKHIHHDKAVKAYNHWKKNLGEASNETPTINHLELSEEEINELSPAALQKYKAVSRERMRDQGVVGKELQKRQTGYSTATKKLSGDAKVGAKEPEKKPEPSFGVKVGKITPKTPYKSSYTMIKEPPQRGASSMPQKAAASPMKEEEETELSPKQKKIAQVSHPKDKIDAGDLAKLRAGHKISEGRKPKDGGDPGDEGSYVDPETGEKSAPPKKHIMNQLRQAAQSMKAQHPVTYADGSTHNVPKHVAKALVNAYQDPRKKPYEREAMQAKIGQSHKELMQHHSELNEDSYNPKLSHKGKMLDEVPVETMKQVKMVNQEEAEEEPPFEPTKKVNWRASKQSRAKWLAKTAMEKMKKKSMKEEEAVKPGAQYAKKVSIPEEVNEEPTSHQEKTTMKHIKNPTPGEKQAAKDIKPGVAGYRDRIDMLKSAQQRNEKVNEEQIVEREMSSDEKAKREKIVMALKKKMAGFKERYGSRAKDVMYATATKQAMKQEETSDGPKDGVKINPPMSTKEGIGIKSTTT